MEFILKIIEIYNATHDEKFTPDAQTLEEFFNKNFA
jgi:hypothetical protein